MVPASAVPLVGFRHRSTPGPMVAVAHRSVLPSVACVVFSGEAKYRHRFFRLVLFEADGEGGGFRRSGAPCRQPRSVPDVAAGLVVATVRSATCGGSDHAAGRVSRASRTA